MDHRLLERLSDRDDHRGVFAGRVVRLVVLRLDVASALVEQQQRFFPGARDAVRLDVQNRYAVHMIPSGGAQKAKLTTPNEKSEKHVILSAAKNLCSC